MATAGRILGVFTADFDGRRALREVHIFGVDTVRRYEFTIGGSERLSVRLEKIRPALFAGFRRQGFHVVFNDALIAEY